MRTTYNAQGEPRNEYAAQSRVARGSKQRGGRVAGRAGVRRTRRTADRGMAKYAGSWAKNLWPRLDAMDCLNQATPLAATLLLRAVPFMLIVSAPAGLARPDRGLGCPGRHGGARAPRKLAGPVMDHQHPRVRRLFLVHDVVPAGTSGRLAETVPVRRCHHGVLDRLAGGLPLHFLRHGHQFRPQKTGQSEWSSSSCRSS